MAKRKEIVQVSLDEGALALVDIYRQGVKARTGKLPTRSKAIVDLIVDATRGVEPMPLRTYAELLKTTETYGDRIDSLEAAVADLLDTTLAEETQEDRRGTIDRARREEQ